MLYGISYSLDIQYIIQYIIKLYFVINKVLISGSPSCPTFSFFQVILYILEPFNYFHVYVLINVIFSYKGKPGMLLIALFPWLRVPV